MNTSAKQLLKEFCRPANYLELILELATERGIGRDSIFYLIDSGEYGVGMHNNRWIVRKSELFIPKVPKHKHGIDKCELLAFVDTRQVFSNELKVDLKPVKWQSTLCPFHEDSHPSFRIVLPDGGYFCHSCDASGKDIINFIMALHRLRFPEAIDYLARQYTTLETRHRHD